MKKYDQYNMIMNIIFLINKFERKLLRLINNDFFFKNFLSFFHVTVNLL